MSLIWSTYELVMKHVCEITKKRICELAREYICELLGNIYVNILGRIYVSLLGAYIRNWILSIQPIRFHINLLIKMFTKYIFKISLQNMENYDLKFHIR